MNSKIKAKRAAMEELKSVGPRDKSIDFDVVLPEIARAIGAVIEVLKNPKMNQVFWIVAAALQQKFEDPADDIDVHPNSQSTMHAAALAVAAFRLGANGTHEMLAKRKPARKGRK